MVQSPPDRVAPMDGPSRVALALVFVLMACLALRDVSSGDVGFHLAAGGRILDGLGWPGTDPFTFTVSDHAYVDTSWGYQVVLALLERGFGAAGLVLFHAALVIVMLLLVYRSARLGPAEPQTLVWLLGLGGLAAELRYQVRPELLSYALLALVLHLLHRHAAGKLSPLWLLPPLFLLWANMHSLFALGWIALGCFAVGLALRDRRLDRRLLGWSAASLIAPLVNPYGWRGVVFPLTLATRFEEANPFNETIGEFRSPFELGLSEQFPFYPRLPIFSFRLLFVLALVALIPLLRRRRWAPALLWLPFAYLSWSMVRNMPLLVVACLPATAWGLSLERIAAGLGCGPALRLRLTRLASAVLAAACLLLALRVYHDAYYIAHRRQDRFGIGWNELSLPVGAADYAGRAGLDGRVLNHLNFGGYLIWSRGQPVFIDGRLEVIGEEFFDVYRGILADAGALESAVALYDIRWSVFPYGVAPRLLARLSADPRWTLAYVDPLAVVFVRTGTLAPERIDPGARAELGPAATLDLRSVPQLGADPGRGALARWLSGLVRRERFPSEPFYLGLFHYWRGDAARAAPRFAEAIRDSDGAYFETFLNLGSALYRLGRLDEARDCYRVVLERRPGNRVARQRLAEIERRASGP